MIFDFLLKRLRRAAPRDVRADNADEDDAIDPLNPFPDVVVVPFRDVLDLHSIPPKQVRAVVEDYLEEARARVFRCAHHSRQRHRRTARDHPQPSGSHAVRHSLRRRARRSRRLGRDRRHVEERKETTDGHR